MARSMDLNTILNYPEENRNDEWERVFFEALIESCVQIDSHDPQAGPDGWPYLFVSSHPQATEPVVRILDWLATRGIGMVINGGKKAPDYVFSYGMIWNFKERHQFITPLESNVVTGQIQMDAGQKVLAGPPSTGYLPEYVRGILRQFLSAQGLQQPRVLVMSRDQKHYDFCFSLESLGNPPKTEHPGIAEALAWFLPGHYSLMLVSESGLPEFHAL